MDKEKDTWEKKKVNEKRVKQGENIKKKKREDSRWSRKLEKHEEKFEREKKAAAVSTQGEKGEGKKRGAWREMVE